MSPSPKPSLDDLVAENARLLKTNEELKSQVAIHQARLEEMDQKTWARIEVIERLIILLRDHNHSHLLAEAYNIPSRALDNLTLQQKKDIHDSLEDNLQGLDEVGFLATSLLDLVPVSFGGEKYRAVILRSEDYQSIHTIIHQETKKKKYRQHALDARNRIESWQMREVEGWADLDNKRFQEGDKRLLLRLEREIKKCEAAMQVPIGQLSRQLAAVFFCNDVRDSNTKEVQEPSAWMYELRTLIKERYDTEDHKEDDEFKKDVLDSITEPELILETDPFEWFDGEDLVIWSPRK